MTTPAPAPNGLLLLDKPQGPSSHGLVAGTRKALGTRRVGHAGTLDPMATGLMVLGIGPATRLLGYVTGADKDYEATVRLGLSTSTEDAEGRVVAAAPRDAVAAADRERVLAGMRRLTGRIMQVPSAVSAIRVDGVRAYRRVRDGEDVRLEARPVEIDAFELLGMRESSAPEGPVRDLDVRVRCSSGTYIRALARDLGAWLGTGAHLTRLRRTRVGPFELADAARLDDGPEFLRGRILSPADAAAALFPVIRADEAEALALRQGRRPRLHPPARTEGAQPPQRAAVLDGDGRLVGLVELGERGTDGSAQARPLFNMPVPAPGRGES